jgi:hypothetical protein
MAKTHDKTDKRANNGGARVGAGRKPKIDEDKKNDLFVNAIKTITGKETDDEAKTALLVKLWNTSSRGQLFIAEHIFGKPKEQVEVTNKNEFPDLSNYTTDELEKLIQIENEENGING